MMKMPVRGSITLALVALVAAAVAVTAQAGTVIGLLDVSKQVSKIQERVDRLTAAGETVKTGVLTAKAVCGDPPSSQVFAPWGDSSDYVLAPAGSLEAASGWTWDRNSGLVADNNSFSRGAGALFLGTQGKAVSPPMCVTTRHPTIRFFARNTGATDSLLSVSVLYEDTNGKLQRLKIASLVATSTWAPTISIPYKVNLLAAASPNGVTAVSFLFEASRGKGASGRSLQMSSGKDHNDNKAWNDDKKGDQSKGEGDKSHNNGKGPNDPKTSATAAVASSPASAPPPAASPSSTNTDAPKKSAKSTATASRGAAPNTPTMSPTASGWEIDDLYVDPFRTN